MTLLKRSAHGVCTESHESANHTSCTAVALNFEVVLAAAKRSFAAPRTCRALVVFSLQLVTVEACRQRWSLRVRIRYSSRLEE